MVPRLLRLTGAILIGGCAAIPVATPISSDHPASVDAPEALYTPQPSTLSQDGASPLSGAASQSASDDSSHEHHGTSRQPPDMSGMPGMPSMTTRNSSTTQPQQSQTIYTCPMHPEVVRSAPGRGPKCGMTLVKAKEQHVGEHQ